MGFWVRAATRVVARPSLWPTAIEQALLLARPRWWRQAPFLPVPDPDYLRYRLETQYGSRPARDRMNPSDLVDYLEWCREVAKRTRGHGRRR
jgi:hypothetical protein